MVIVTLEFPSRFGTHGRMPHTIVFDTNYLRSFSAIDYREGRVPQKLHEQISAALERGDLVVVPRTVKFETNAWLLDQSLSAWRKQDDARELLRQAGHEVIPEGIPKPEEVDVVGVLRSAFPSVDILEPTIDEYAEAERRTSYRLPPCPKKPEAEEFRDRLIWCQLLNYSATTGAPSVLIVSGDRIFKNGAESEEGAAANIDVVEGETDLDQWLNQRPPHIQLIVDQLLTFSEQLENEGIVLTAEAISAIEELRKVKEPSGFLTQKFSLRTEGVANLPSPAAATIVSLEDDPLSLNVVAGDTAVRVTRALDDEARERLTLAQVRDALRSEHAGEELKALLRGE